MLANSAVMGMSPRDLAHMSLAEWIALSEGWAKAHDPNAGKPPAPTDEEFWAAMKRNGAT